MEDKFQPNIQIILVNYKSADDTIECIKSLEAMTYSNAEYIVVNNYAPEYDKLNNFIMGIEKCTLIETGSNLGFSGGNNVGIKMALNRECDYILLLNNDTIVTSEFLEPLVACANSHGKAGIVTGKIMYHFDPDLVWYAGGEISFTGGYIDHYGYNRKNSELNDDNNDKKISFATGCLWLIPVNVIEQVGMLSEEYFLYSEDTDYCCRIMQNKFQIWYTPKSVIYHKVSASSGNNSKVTQYYSVRNDYYVFSKYAPKNIKRKAIIKLTKRKIESIIRGDISLKWYLKGVKDFRNNIKGKIEL